MKKLFCALVLVSMCGATECYKAMMKTDVLRALSLQYMPGFESRGNEMFEALKIVYSEHFMYLDYDVREKFLLKTLFRAEAECKKDSACHFRLFQKAAEEATKICKF